MTVNASKHSTVGIRGWIQRLDTLLLIGKKVNNPLILNNRKFCSETVGKRHRWRMLQVANIL